MTILDWMRRLNLRRGMQLAVVCGVLGGALPQEGVAETEVDKIPWNERTWEQKFVESSYEDEFTFKHQQMYVQDPFVWSLSKEFAERFGMPKQWIDPELKGALAVAWRTSTIGKTFCGHGGNPEACWPVFTCQLDLYMDSKAPIPWRFDDVERDFLWDGLTSIDYVPRRAPAPRRARYILAESELVTKGPPFLNTGWRYKGGFTHMGFFPLYFDRAYAPEVVLLGFEACPSLSSKGEASVRFFTQEEQTRTQGNIKNFVHDVSFSTSFMHKITEKYQKEKDWHDKSNSALQQTLKRFAPNSK